MKLSQDWKLRLATLATLVKRARQKPGRTALMKFAYFLQTVRGVPLGYQFDLYDYGPYDSTVLGDLSLAVTMNMLKSESVQYPSGGIGYQYSPQKALEPLCRLVADDLAKYDNDISWVLDHFGYKSAAELELLSTIVFAEREAKRKSQILLQIELVRRVKRIKPHFDETVIAASIELLINLGLISVK